MLPFGSKNIQEFTERWNDAIPIDRWYRKKYNIPFNSSSHKQICLADMFYEFWEFINYEYIPLKTKKKNNEKEEKYVRGEGNFMKTVKYSVQDIDRIFDELDIDSID